MVGVKVGGCVVSLTVKSTVFPLLVDQNIIYLAFCSICILNCPQFTITFSIPRVKSNEVAFSEQVKEKLTIPVRCCMIRRTRNSRSGTSLCIEVTRCEKNIVFRDCFDDIS